MRDSTTRLSGLVFVSSSAASSMASIFKWFLRCIPGLSTICLLLLIELSLGVARSFYRFIQDGRNEPIAGPVILQILFVSYSLLLHVLALSFPIRVSFAARAAAQGIRNYHGQSSVVKHDSDYTTMVIIIPCYKEDIETLQDTLDVLACHEGATKSYNIFLAMEERDPFATKTATTLLQQYHTRFASMEFTMHPAGLPEESAGKSSNVSWAAHRVMATYAERSDVLVTVMDSDSHLLPQYFSYIQSIYGQQQREYGQNNMVLFVPPVTFDRNAHCVPRPVRTADILWSGAGLSNYGTLPSSAHLAIPTSVYTLSLPLVQLANGWDAGPEAIGEDMHMMLKCYFATNGQLKIVSVPSPASMCNISVATKGLRGYFSNLRARYTQGLRHMWGCLDSGYAVDQWLKIGKIPGPKSPISSPRQREGRARLRKSSDASKHPVWLEDKPKRFTMRNMILFMRMFEAHFLPLHYFICIVASGAFAAIPPSSDEWEWMQTIIDSTGWLRFAGFFAMMIYLSIAYEDYHRTCIKVRETEMKKAGLYDSESFSVRRPFTFTAIFDYVLFPVAGVVYGALPAFQAAITHFRTQELVYLVSAKPLRAAVRTVPQSESQSSEEHAGLLQPV